MGRGKKKNKNGKTRKFRRPSERTLFSKYNRSLGKWLKVIFWHYEDLRKKIEKDEKRLAELEKTVKLLSKRIKSIEQKISDDEA